MRWLRPGHTFRIFGLSTLSTVDLDAVAYQWSEENPVCFRNFSFENSQRAIPQSGPVKGAGVWLSWDSIEVNQRADQPRLCCPRRFQNYIACEDGGLEDGMAPRAAVRSHRLAKIRKFAKHRKHKNQRYLLFSIRCRWQRHCFIL